MSKFLFTLSNPYLINCRFQPFDNHAVRVYVQLAQSHSIHHPSVHVRLDFSPLPVSLLLTSCLFLFCLLLTFGKLTREQAQ